jgi:fucose 4-O-acetylase-like acetyltransferase
MSAAINSMERIAWLDACKGICIVLVVYGHISGGLEVSGKLAQNTFWLALREWVYLFHMPAFFALSGMLAAKVTKLSPQQFFLGRLRTICFPYIVWTVILVGTQYVLARYANTPPDLSRARRFLVEPYGYGLWFLYSLLIISLIYYLLARWRIPVAVKLMLALILSLLASRNVFAFWPIFNTSMSFFIYYAVAACASESQGSLFPDRGRLQELLSGAFLLLTMTLLHMEVRDRGWLFNLVLAGLGIMGVICLAKGLAKTITNRFWAVLGMFSLEIYLGHPLWGTLARAGLLRSGIDSPAVFVLAGVGLGLAGSLLIGVLCRTWNFPYLFKWPQRQPRNLEAVPA